jgi:hypothetical protein
MQQAYTDDWIGNVPFFTLAELNGPARLSGRQRRRLSLTERLTRVLERLHAGELQGRGRRIEASKLLASAETLLP